MKHLVLSADLCSAIGEVWAYMPIWKKERGRIIFINDVPVPNISWRNRCALYDAQSGVCKKNCMHMVRLENGSRVMKPTTMTLMTRRVKDNEWWGSYAEEGQETVDISVVTQEETESILAQDRKVRGLKANMSEYRPVGTAWEVLRDRDSYTCSMKIGDKWYTCPFHSGYSEVMKRIQRGGDVMDIARDILWFFVRPDYRQKQPSREWTWNDYVGFRALISQQVVYMANRKKNPVPIDVARKRAWAQWMNAHPETDGYISSVENVGLSAPLIEEACRDAFLYLRRNGFDVSKKEALDAYNWSVTTRPIRKERFHVHSTVWRCPRTINAPEGKRAARIIRHTAVTDRFKEIYAESVDEHNAVVQLHDGSYMSAVAFNWHSLKERKELLGCSCKHCSQEDIWFPNEDEKGLKFFTFKAEALYHLDRMEVMAGDLSRLQELNKDKCPLSSQEEDWLDESRRALAYDLTELPDERNLDADEEYIEELDSDLDDEKRIQAWENSTREVGATNLNYLETSDRIDLLLADAKKSGPVKVYFVDPATLKYGGLEIEKRVETILSEGKSIQAKLTVRKEMLSPVEWKSLRERKLATE